jgi:hypothetical protein
LHPCSRAEIREFVDAVFEGFDFRSEVVGLLVITGRDPVFQPLEM